MLQESKCRLGVMRFDEDSLGDVAADFVKLDLLREVRVVHLDKFLLSHLDCLDECKLMVTADQDLRLLLVLDHC